MLGTGLEYIYPNRHRSLARGIVEGCGAQVSELLLDSQPHPVNFPRSNRIISGLSLGVLVVEASPCSGSLITAHLVAEQGREVYAIPGSIHHPSARGCHELIHQRAALVESVEHILEGLQGWTQSECLSPKAKRAHPLLALLRAQRLGVAAPAGGTDRARTGLRGGRLGASRRLST